MQSRISTQKIIIAALLIIVGVAIPMFSPVKLVLDPASFTLASHVPIFIAMFISPILTLAVAIGTAIGFYVGGFTTVVTVRAASHILFALIGAYYLHYKPQVLSSIWRTLGFALIIGIIHAWVETTVVIFFYMGGDMSETGYTLNSVLLLVGLGGLAHSMVDFAIAFGLLKLLLTRKSLKPIFVTSKIPESV
ncbi:MAG: hypothetical protein LBN43_09985 [Oscillospiraceae bacterium]|jgi:niacin transporter|nr:hypothetical protein [Oscillospiraceae bacterium]